MSRLVAAIAFLLVLPSVSAAWYGQGSMEPDTAFDQDAELMWQDAPSAPDRVYFNAYQTSYLTGINPNSGTAGTHTTAPIVHINAMLGVWLDCNGDGYIGMPEGALSEYRAELLNDRTLCPPGESRHNDGQWVFEFFHLGPYEETASREYNVIDAPGVLLWGDLGLPGALPGHSCPLSPPQGTFKTTGGMLRWADCLSGSTGAATVNSLDPNDDLGLKFDDPKNPQSSDSLLNQVLPVNLFGNPNDDTEAGMLESGTGRPTFTTWDCSAEAFRAEDPTAANPEDGHIATVYMPAPAVLDPNGSVIDGVNQTERGILNDCDSEAEGTWAEFAAGLVNPESSLQSEGQASGGKNEVHTTFSFFDGTAANSNLTAVTGANTPRNLGLALGGNLLAPGWTSQTIITSEEFYVSPESGPVERRYFTFYAYVPSDLSSQLGLQLPGATGSRIYGSDNCSVIGPGAGSEGGWNCDPDQWYLDSFGNPVPPRLDVRVGAAYQMRDVDCLNGLPLSLAQGQLNYC